MKRLKALLFTSLLVLVGLMFFKSYQIGVEKENEFVIYGLIRMGAIYSLVGDKPVTTFGYYSSEEESEDSEMEESEESDFEMGENDVLLDMSKIKFTKNDFYNFEKFPELWISWQKTHGTNGKHFALVCVKRNGINWLELVNKRRVREIMKAYYLSMVQSLGVEFDIEQVVSQIGNPESFFWTHIMNIDYGHVCPGLMYGFGLENALEFQTYSDNSEDCVANLEKMNPLQPLEDRMNALFSVHVSLADLILPHYMMFIDPDPVLEHYKAERARIQREYKDADLRKLFIEAFK